MLVLTYKMVVNKTDNEQKPLGGAEFKLEKLKADGSYAEVENVTKEGVDSSGTTIQGAKFTFKGLDDGKYKLTETTTPTGYNSIEPIEFTVKAGHITSWTPTGLEFGQDFKLNVGDTGYTLSVSDIAPNTNQISPDNGALSTTVVNTPASTLPETGGMGTTLLYLVGGALVLVAGGLLVAKKRRGR